MADRDALLGSCRDIQHCPEAVCHPLMNGSTTHSTFRTQDQPVTMAGNSFSL